MAKGRKPENDNVVPLTGDGLDDERMHLRGVEIADDLKPDYLTAEGAKVYDRIAPHVASPRVGRLKPHTMQAFVMMCEALARHERLRKFLMTPGVDEVYTSETRNGFQMKARPEVAQLNVTFSQFLTIARDFGLTPAAERGLAATPPGQGELDFDNQDFG